MEKVSVSDSVSETLFINIPIKADEHRRPGGIINDPYSAELMANLNYDFDKFKAGAMASAGVVVRTQYFDEETLAFIEEGGDEEQVVVHVGAGLDTRYSRIGGPGLPAMFYELDLQDVMDLRARMLPPQGNEQIIGSSMFDTEWMDALAANHPEARFLFVMEGVVFYFPEERIRELFGHLAARFRGAILCDLISPWTRKRFDKNKGLKDIGTRFDFAVSNAREVEAWHPKIHLEKDVSLVRRHPRRWGFLAGRILPRVPAIRDSSRLATYRLG